jgi:predicted Zn-dependent protease
MRINEIASAEDQMALWRLVSDSVWQAIETQRQQQAQAEQAKAAGNTSVALEQFQTAFAAARDIAQVKALAASIRGLGGEVDLPRHLGFRAC